MKTNHPHPRPRYGGLMFSDETGDGFYIYGGATVDKDGSLDDLWRYSITDDKWELVCTHAGIDPPVNGMVGVMLGDRLVVYGGTAGGYHRVRNELYLREPGTACFKRIQNPGGKLPEARFVCAACGDGENRMWVFGGLKNGRKDTDELWEYRLNTNIWRQIDAPGTPSPRHGIPMVFHDNSLYVFGGHCPNSCLHDFHRFDLKAGQWSSLNSEGKLPDARYIQSMTLYDKCIYLFAGSAGSKYNNDLHVYDIEKNTWQQRLSGSEKGVPSPRCFVLSVLVKTRIYYFSGWMPKQADGSEVTGELYSYDPATNTFHSLS